MYDLLIRDRLPAGGDPGGALELTDIVVGRD
jgi:hypothetical protein